MACVDSAWKQEKLEARKMLAVDAAESPAFSAGFAIYRWLALRKTCRLKKDTMVNLTRVLSIDQAFAAKEKQNFQNAR